jgi:hypothetical protein
LEQRLGRKLTRSDFIEGNCLNDVSDKWSERSVDRLQDGRPRRAP